MALFAGANALYLQDNSDQTELDTYDLSQTYGINLMADPDVKKAKDETKAKVEEIKKDAADAVKSANDNAKKLDAKGGAKAAAPEKKSAHIDKALMLQGLSTDIQSVKDTVQKVVAGK